MDLLAGRNRRRLLFAALYFSEGAPIGFLWWYLPTQLRAAGVPIGDITRVTALLVLPWTFKFLWAPLVDGRRARGGTYRAWIVGAQLLMGLLLVPLFFLDLQRHLAWIVPLLLAHSLAAATQDVAVDGLAVAVTAEGERGALNGWMQAGMLLGRSLFGGAALVAAAHLGPRWVPVILLGAVWVSLALVAGIREPRGAARPPGSGLLAGLRAAVARRATWLGLAFGLVAGAGFEAVGAVVGPYLVDRGMPTGEVGRFLAVPAVAAMLAGALLGGPLADRVGRLRSVAVFLVALAAAVFALSLPVTRGETATLAVLTALYFAIGLFTASSYALFMDLTDPRLGATQFSAYMAATNGCEAWAGFLVGQIAGPLGYGPAFRILALVSLAGLPLLVSLRRARPAGSPGGPAAAPAGARSGDPASPSPPAGPAAG